MENFEAELSWANLARKVKILNLCSDKTADIKFSEVVSSAGTEIQDWILKEAISNWSQLVLKVEARTTEKININNLVEICAEHRRPGDDPEEYMKLKIAQLKNFGVEDSAIIKLVGACTWPHIQRLKLELSNCRTLNDLE